MMKDDEGKYTIPTQEEIDAYLDTLPASTREVSARIMGVSVTQVARIKSYLMHNPGPKITTSRPGQPDYMDQPRHQIIEPGCDASIRGLHDLVHTMRMYNETVISEMRARMVGVSPMQAAWLEALCVSLGNSVITAKYAEK